MSKQVLVIGHRGAKGHVIENTLASFKKALAFQVDGIELDVHLCASGELVVFHDFTLDRLTNGSGEISKFTLSELNALTVDNQYTIPTLTEVLELFDTNAIINIELKGRHTATETVKTIEQFVIKKGWNYHNFIVSSFQHHELEQVYKLNKNIPIGVLTKANMEDAIEFAKTVKAEAIHPNFSLLSKNNVAFAQQLGYKVYTWTVNSPEAILRMKTYKVDGIITDFPDRV